MTPGEQNRDYYREQGRKEEQERIIELLELEQSSSICDESCYCLPCDLGETEIMRNQFKSIISLIKGQA